MLDWLLSYAIGIEYSDRVEELQQIQPQPAEFGSSSCHERSVACKEPIELDLDSADFKSNLNELAECLGVPKDDSIEAMLRACAAVLEQKFTAGALDLALKEQVVSHVLLTNQQRVNCNCSQQAVVNTSDVSGSKLQKKRSKRGPTKWSAEQFPSGFETGTAPITAFHVPCVCARRMRVSDPQCLDRIAPRRNSSACGTNGSHCGCLSRARPLPP